MTKNELLQKLESQREDFLDALEGIPESDWELPGVAGNWSIKDILAHLSRWEAELVKFLWQVQQGQTPTSIQLENIDVDAVNAAWQREARDRSLQRVLEDYHLVRTQTAARVEMLDEKDLLAPNRFKWAKGKPLWEWIAADSYEHEAEHLQDILAWKQRKST